MKPVFTQEMSDNGELPSVGMEYLDGVVLVDMDADGMYVVQEAGVSIICAPSGITPIPAPIKLVNGQLYNFTIDNKELVGEAYYVSLGEVWMINALRTNRNYYPKDCTNIIKLVQEVKV